MTFHRRLVDQRFVRELKRTWCHRAVYGRENQAALASMSVGVMALPNGMVPVSVWDGDTWVGPTLEWLPGVVVGISCQPDDSALLEAVKDRYLNGALAKFVERFLRKHSVYRVGGAISVA